MFAVFSVFVEVFFGICESVFRCLQCFRYLYKCFSVFAVFSVFVEVFFGICNVFGICESVFRYL